MSRRKDGEETKEKILKAAAFMFAKNGFKSTTNADIVQQCGGINSALISYYFSSKTVLYMQAQEYSFQKAAEKYPLPAETTGSPEKRLLELIAICINRDVASGCIINDIIQHEITTATGILNDFCNEVYFDVQEMLYQLLNEILGEQTPKEEKDFAVCSIMSMLMIPNGRIKAMNMTLLKPEKDLDPEAWIKHVQLFALGGITALKNKYRV